MAMMAMKGLVLMSEVGVEIGSVGGLGAYQQERVIRYIRDRIRMVSLSVIDAVDLYVDGRGDFRFLHDVDHVVDCWYMCLDCNGSVISVDSSDVVNHVLHAHGGVLGIDAERL